MKRKFTALLMLIVGIHGVAVFQSCIFPRCNDVAYFVSAIGVDFFIYSIGQSSYDGWNNEPPYHRATLNLSMNLKSDESIYMYSRQHNGGIISYANATQECEGDYPVFKEHIRDIKIIKRFDAEGNTVNEDVSELFVVDGEEWGLYTEIENVLANKSTTRISIAYKEIPQGDSLGLIVKTYLSDDRVFSDTLNIPLK